MYKTIFFTLALASQIPVCAVLQNGIVKASRSLELPIPYPLKNKHFKHIRSFLVQCDDWSCALRALAHMQAFEKALKDPAHFDQALKKELQNKKPLSALDSTYGKDQGYEPEEIYSIAKNEGLAKKTLYLDIEYTGAIYCPLQQRDPYSVKQLLKKLVARAHKPPCAVYAMVGSEHHALLFAFVKLPDTPAKLYFIDSLNLGINRERKRYIDLFLPYLDALDAADKEREQKEEKIARRFLMHPLMYALTQPYKHAQEN